MNTKQIVLAARPKGKAQLSDFRFEETKIPELKTGEVLLMPLYFSVDPYMRGRMNDDKSYIQPFQIDQPIVGSALSTIVKSKSENFKEGDIVLGMTPWSEASVLSDKGLQKVDANQEHISYFLSVLGMIGLTAYVGLINICKPLAGETVVVSGAAGAVGIVVGQIAKILGCKVVGITGSDDKVKQLVEKFGFDEAINYKTTTYVNKAIRTICNDGVDIYFDNVGGEISDAVISNLNVMARIAVCGQISLYNSTEIPTGPRLQTTFISKNIMLQGFIIGNYKSEFPEAIRQLTQWVNEGKLKFTETVFEGFEELPNAFLGLFNGENTGKMIVKI
jgi:NADPH-dependent curcumin reductase CurA